MKPVRVILIGDAQSAYQRINAVVGEQRRKGKANTEEMQLLKSIQQKRKLAKANPFFGDNIPKRLIPKEYNVKNLWRAELSHYWRMLYTIKGDQVEIICFVLEIIDHKTYDKKFKYKKK